MHAVLRKSIFAIPFACLVAIATHFVRFGEDHVFGGNANDALVSAAIGGSIVIAIAILHAFLAAGTTLMTGTLAAARMRAFVPEAPVIFSLAACLYYGIEVLEGNGLEIGLPTLVLLTLSIAVAMALGRLAAFVAQVVADIICQWLALLDRRENLIWHRPPAARPMHSLVAIAAQRFGRAPPTRRRSP